MTSRLWSGVLAPGENHSTCPINVSYINFVEPTKLLNRHSFYLLGSLLCKAACFTSIQKLLSLHATEKLD